MFSLSVCIVILSSSVAPSFVVSFCTLPVAATRSLTATTTAAAAAAAVAAAAASSLFAFCNCQFLTVERKRAKVSLNCDRLHRAEV